MGSPQIRNVATVAGNLVSGQPAADASLPLLALNARVKILSQTGEREVPLTQFFLDQGRTALDCRREILTQIRFPALQKNQGGCYLRLSLRKALALPILAVATVVTVEPEKRTITGGRDRPGTGSPNPVSSFQNRGQAPKCPGLSKESLEMAAQTAIEESNPRSSLLRGSKEYRKAMVKVFIRRGLSRALADAGAAAMEGLK